MKVLVILFIAFIAYVALYQSKFLNLKQYTNDVNPPTPQSCNYTQENRVYPSGHIPGSFLTLSPSEKMTQLQKYILFQQQVV